MPSLDEIVTALSHLIERHWLKALFALAFTLGGWWLARWRAQRAWHKREFFNRINISLNTIDDGYLRIRTVLEDPLDEVFLNKAASELVRKAATKTPPGNPILPLPEEDRWFVHNEVLNQLAEHFSPGQVRHDMGIPTQSAVYIIALTCEKEGAIRTYKVRAMMMRKDALLNLPTEMPRFERPTHETRFHTLKTLAAAYRRDPEQFIEMEVHQ